MIKVTVFYPAGEGKTFDIDYYTKKHMPMVKELCGSACKQIAVDQGVAGGTPGSKPAYLAMGHLFFDTVDAFQQSFGPHAKQIMADVPNYTNTQPQVQINEIKL